MATTTAPPSPLTTTTKNPDARAAVSALAAALEPAGVDVVEPLAWQW